MGSKSRRSNLGQYVLGGSIALVILAVAVLAAVMVKRQMPAKDETPRAAPTRAPAVAAAAPSQPPVTPTPAPAPTRSTPVVEEKPIAITSDELRQQHANNESMAGQRFKDKQLQVTGTVSMIYQEAPLVGIGFGTIQDTLPAVLCEMSPQQAGGLSQVRPGQVITIIGAYTGRIQGGFIGLGRCRIVVAGRN